MNLDYLDFEQSIAELEEKISEFRRMGDSSSIDIHDEVRRLEKKSQDLTKSIFSSLSDWQIVSLARHPKRPQTLDYIENIFTDFVELHGDRHYGDDCSIIAGMARLDNHPVIVIGHQKGRSTKNKIKHNFGMPRPEGYRKALRVMQMGERFGLPILTFIDTPGAYPGVDAEEHNQSEAIAKNLLECSALKTPIICTVIGEGGSGGALAIGVGDSIFMLEYSVYSVISPEGCASILWKSADKAAVAAQALSLTANKLKNHKIIDDIIKEPLGGAHRDVQEVVANVKKRLSQELTTLKQYHIDDLLKNRQQKLMDYGKFNHTEK
jgi:acetyl-CoA carboxylase carboxyl transferase subunit alpha